MVFLKRVVIPWKPDHRRTEGKKIIKKGWLAIGLCILFSVNMPFVKAQEVEPSTLGGIDVESRILPIFSAPDATRLGPFATTVSEYRLPATVDPDIIGDRETEIWASVHRPVDFYGGPAPVIVSLHGNHGTCGRGSNPRIDDRIDYSATGTCPVGYVVVPNHRGYDYLAERLASWGYVAVSINANRGINVSQGTSDDKGLNLTRGRLILKHLQLLSTWNTAGGTPASLGVDLRGKLDFKNLGLMGHSRGGEGVRAAYNLYRDPGSPWPTRIPQPLSFRGIFEFAPVDGQTSRVLNADGLPWNVLLPECDGDVANLQGVKPFDRMLRIFDENPATPKSTYTVWGANHNYYNTEWQTSDSSGCLNHQPIFTPGPSVGSEPQRQTGLASLLAFMRGNVPGSLGYNPRFNQNFNPQFALPRVVTSVTQINRGYTSSPNAAVTRVLEDFDQPTGTSSAGLPNVANNISVVHNLVPEHDPSLRAGAIAWSRPGNDVFFQSNFAAVGQGINISSYRTLDLRVENQDPSALSTNFSVVLVRADGRLSRPASISRYVDLIGPVGGPGGIHRMLQTARIPLIAFGLRDLTNIRGVRLIFNKTEQGAIYVANIRLSAISELGQPIYSLPKSQLPPFAISPSLRTGQSTVVKDGNQVVGIRRVVSAKAIGSKPGVEIEVMSNQPFPIRNELAILRIGDREFMLSRYPDPGDQKRLIFTLTEEEFAQVSSGEKMWVQYGRGEASELWDFGSMDKSNLK